MGYYTDYHLDIEVYNKDYNQIEPAPETIVNQVKECFCKLFDNCGCDAWGCDEEDFHWITHHTVNWTWYDHEGDMKKLAKLFPDLYFTLEGKGEEVTDIWIKQFHGDEYYEDFAQIAYPEKKWE